MCKVLEALAIAFVDEDARVEVDAAHLPGTRTPRATPVLVAVRLDDAT
jgi:hypothetical protein